MDYFKAIPIKPGHAELVFTNANLNQPTVFVSIQRKGHQESHLGGKGWQVSEHTFELPARLEGNELRIEVGKRIVGYLEGNSNYEFLVGEATDNKGLYIVRWRGVPEYRLSEDDDDGPSIDPTPKPITIGRVSQDPVDPDPPQPISPEPPKPIPPEPPKPVPPQPPIPSGNGPTRIFCPNGHAVLSTFKKCPTCSVAIDPQAQAAGNTVAPSPTTIQATPIQPTPIKPTVVSGSQSPISPIVTPIPPVSMAGGASKTFCGNCGKPVLSTMIKCPNCGQATGVVPSVGQVNAPQAGVPQSIPNGAAWPFNVTNSQDDPLSNPASRWARLGAAIIDNTIIGNVVFWLILKFGFSAEYVDLISDQPLDPVGSSEIIPLAYFINFVIMVLYHSIMNVTDEAGTFGKMICGIRVRDYQGQRISFGASLGRTLLTLIPVLSLGMFYIFFNDKRQTMADAVCKTIVIKKG